ncbi:hypothetical protein [Cellvibrio polysaccharolyticus]|uniref:Transcriptional regulator SutA RNAP-binding domain-containing protein n=1 Tax=Cellvibrio polysaccharolyticus TaxID=2082724 RepID=A0A928YTE6_9GAMM|nr:hypothetical protein [Cellvibrio polysaccharolyticus]MBE8716772.1 hypothetical protein [Cellvibrio polysaccharolyticus]
MKPTKTKREIRNELQEQIDAFLHQGGAVAEIPRGISGREDTSAPLRHVFIGPPSEDRTLVSDVVAAIESRKKPAPHRPTHKPRPKKKIILDDFGQPLRWEWVEE